MTKSELLHDHCPTCDAPMREYRHPLGSKGMMRVVQAMFDEAGLSDVHVVDLPHLSITDASTGNWMKAAYWGLIETDNKRSGMWHVTESGKRFLSNETRLAPAVVVYRNRVMRFEGDPILFKDIVYRRQKRATDYLADSTPHALAAVC